MSIPLMLGVSLVSADNWIINYFASHNSGDVSLLTYAKSLFAAPVSLGQAAGAASLPFLASLFTKSNALGRRLKRLLESQSILPSHASLPSPSCFPP